MIVWEAEVVQWFVARVISVERRLRARLSLHGWGAVSFTRRTKGFYQQSWLIAFSGRLTESELRRSPLNGQSDHYLPRVVFMVSRPHLDHTCLNSVLDT